MAMTDFRLAAEKLDLSFRNLDLLAEALTHRSYLNEHRAARQGHNERLEFLGDAVVELATTRFLFENSRTSPKATSRRTAPRW